MNTIGSTVFTLFGAGLLGLAAMWTRPAGVVAIVGFYGVYRFVQRALGLHQALPALAHLFGILLAYFSNYLIGTMGFGDAEWRWKLGIAALPAALFFLMLFGIPRSPRWLARKGRTVEARSVLEAIGEENIESELQAMNAAFDLAAALHGVGDAAGSC